MGLNKSFDNFVQDVFLMAIRSKILNMNSNKTERPHRMADMFVAVTEHDEECL